HVYGPRQLRIIAEHPVALSRPGCNGTPETEGHVGPGSGLLEEARVLHGADDPLLREHGRSHVRPNHPAFSGATRHASIGTRDGRGCTDLRGGVWRSVLRLAIRKIGFSCFAEAI